MCNLWKENTEVIGEIIKILQEQQLAQQEQQL